MYVDLGRVDWTWVTASRKRFHLSIGFWSLGEGKGLLINGFFSSFFWRVYAVMMPFSEGMGVGLIPMACEPLVFSSPMFAILCLLLHIFP